ncbi:hypothetical protein [Xylella fastidiosa]|nr:hypothetical protein [Xylella fastidiosa]
MNRFQRTAVPLTTTPTIETRSEQCIEQIQKHSIYSALLTPATQ